MWIPQTGGYRERPHNAVLQAQSLIKINSHSPALMIYPTSAVMPHYLRTHAHTHTEVCVGVCVCARVNNIYMGNNCHSILHI
jgi:hypothetical protein